MKWVRDWYKYRKISQIKDYDKLVSNIPKRFKAILDLILDDDLVSRKSIFKKHEKALLQKYKTEKM